MKVGLIFAMLLFLNPAVCAQEEAARVAEAIDYSEWQEYADAQGVELDVQETVLSLIGLGGWDISVILQTVSKAVQEKIDDAAMLVAILAVPVLLCALVGQFAARREYTLEWMGVLIASAFLIAEFGNAYETAKRTLNAMNRLVETIFPLLTVLFTAAGGAGSAAMLTPAAAIVSGIITSVASGVGLGLCAGAAGIASACEISSRIRLNKLFELIKNVCNRMMITLMGLFLGVLKIQELLGGAYDSAMVKTARYAADTLIPVVGGEVAGTVDMLAGSVKLVKNASGVTGIVMLAILCLEPVLKIAVPLLACRITTAMLEPISQGRLNGVLERFADVMTMLLVVVISSMVLGMLLLGATLASGGGAV